MVGHLRSPIERPLILEIGGDARRSKGVVADRRQDAGLGAPAGGSSPRRSPAPTVGPTAAWCHGRWSGTQSLFGRPRGRSHQDSRAERLRDCGGRPFEAGDAIGIVPGEPASQRALVHPAHFGDACQGNGLFQMRLQLAEALDTSGEANVDGVMVAWAGKRTVSCPWGKPS